MGWAKFFSCSSLPSFLFFFFFFFYVSSCITFPPGALLCIAVSEYYHHHNTNYWTSFLSSSPPSLLHQTSPSRFTPALIFGYISPYETRGEEAQTEKYLDTPAAGSSRGTEERRGEEGGRGCYEISFNPLVPSLALLPAVVAPFSPVWPCLNGVRPWKI